PILKQIESRPAAWPLENIVKMKAKSRESSRRGRSVDHVAGQLFLRPRIGDAKQAAAKGKRRNSKRYIHRAIVERAAIVLDRAVGEHRERQHRGAAIHP